MNALFKTPIRVGMTVFVAVLIIGFGLRAFGFHFQDLSLVRGGNIVIQNPDVPHTIFLDERTVPSSEETKTYIENVSPNEHTIFVYNELYWPWSKRGINVLPNETLELTPFLIPKNASGFIITREDPEYDSLQLRIAEQILPTKENPLISESGDVIVWVEDNTLYAQTNVATSSIPQYFCDDEGACEHTIEVISPADAIRDVAYYKKYDNILIMSSQNGVFAIEMDKRGEVQNFQPIYKGAGLPRFAKVNEESIVVEDGSALFLINL